MRDLPLEILGNALWFVAANFFTLFRLCWLPIAMLLATQVALGQILAALAGGTSASVLEASPFSEPSFWLSAALQTIALSVVAVRVHRLVLFGDRRPGEYFLFAFGRTEASYVAMVVLLIGAAFAIGLAFAGGVSLLMGPISHEMGVRADDSMAKTVAVTLMAAGVFFTIWFVLRLSLWPVVVVANDGLAPAEAWRVTRQYGVAMFWLFFVSQFLLSFVFLFGMLAINAENLPSIKFLERHLQFGGWISPSVQPFAQTPTPQLIAADFGLSFFVTAFMATLLSFTYLEIKRSTGEEAVA